MQPPLSVLYTSVMCSCIAAILQCGPKISSYPWPAEDLVTCVSRQTGLSAGAIERPTVVQNPLFPVALLGGIIVGGTVAWKLYNSPLVRITGLWTLGALAVYWFSTSGGMYNIIRGIPFTMRNKEGKNVYWMEVRGRGSHLGRQWYRHEGHLGRHVSSSLAQRLFVVASTACSGSRMVLGSIVTLQARTFVQLFILNDQFGL
jgi:oligosaccharyltransferase complex subunit gamma